MKRLHPTSLLLSLLSVACSPGPESAVESASLPDIVPNYIGVTIPDSIAPLNFYCADDAIDRIDVTVTGKKGTAIHVSGEYADFDIDDWHRLLHDHVGDSLSVRVVARADGQWTAYRPFSIYVSGDPIGEWGVTYRLIPPGYETYGVMGIYQRCLADFTEVPIVENRRLEANCMNCHTPNRTNPAQTTFHVRGNHGATVVVSGGKMDVLSPRNEELGGGFVYPYWHPSGRYIAYSSNKTHQQFHQLASRRVEVYDDHSDVIIYRPDTREILLDSMVATREHLENFPAFSPDGRWLYFCAADRVDSIGKQYQDVKYNICRIAFDAATGRFTSKADTIINARQMGKSANMPRLSYDGRFLLYTLSDYGCFPIWHAESDLWMMNLETGENAPLTEANSPDADSFHNWSLNSRWVVFTSRRFNGLYTQLYLVHVDGEGRVAKAFRLPQKNPKEYDVESVNSFNTPDFASSPFPVPSADVYQKLMDTQREATTF